MLFCEFDTSIEAGQVNTGFPIFGKGSENRNNWGPLNWENFENILNKSIYIYVTKKVAKNTNKKQLNKINKHKKIKNSEEESDPVGHLRGRANLQQNLF